MSKLQLIATAPMGLEAVVARELNELGYETKVENGRVLFSGDYIDICRCNLWLRTSDRVLVKMGNSLLKPLTSYSKGLKRCLGKTGFQRMENSRLKDGPINHN